MALVGLNHLSLMKHVSSSVLVRIFAGILLLDIKPREPLPIMLNCHELTLLTLPIFVRVVVDAKIVLLWSIVAPTSSADNLGSTRTSLRISISPFFQAQELCFDFIRHVYAMGQTLRCYPLVNVFL